MNRNTLVVLSLILALFVGGYLFTLHQREAGVRSILTSLGQKAWLQADAVHVYFDQKGGFRLVKKNEHWLIEDGYQKPASKVVVNDFLKQLANLLGEMRAQGENFFSRFKVDEKSALHLVLEKNGQVIGHLLIGKRGPRWQSTFVRLEGSQGIYLVPSNLLAKFDIWSEAPSAPKDKEFVDLQILEAPLSKLKKLTFDSQKQHWSLQRHDKAFSLLLGKKEKKLSEEEAQKFLRRLFPLYAEKVVSPEKFQKKVATLRFESRLGRQVELDFGPCEGKKNKKTCFVKKGPFVYQVSPEVVKKLFNPGGGKS